MDPKDVRHLLKVMERTHKIDEEIAFICRDLAIENARIALRDAMTKRIDEYIDGVYEYEDLQSVFGASSEAREKDFVGYMWMTLFPDGFPEDWGHDSILTEEEIRTLKEIEGYHVKGDTE
jgi:hypothetical protein